MAASEPVRFLAGVRDELLVFFGSKLVRCKFDPDTLELELASAPACNTDFDVVCQKPKLSSAATGSFSAAIEFLRRDAGPAVSSVLQLESGFSIGSHTISLLVETLRKSQVGGSYLGSQNYDSVSSHSQLDYNSLSTVRNVSAVSNSRLQNLQVESMFSHKQSLSHKGSGAETKRRIHDLSQHSPDRSRVEEGHSLRKESSLKGLAQLINSRKEANNSMVRAEEFQSKLKQEMKKIEQKHKHQLNQTQLVASFGSNDSVHEQPSMLTAGGQRARKQRDHILEAWPEEKLGEDHETIRTKKMNLIRSLINGRQAESPAEQNSSDPLPVAQASCKLDKKLKIAQIKENLNRIEVIPSELVSYKDTIDYELSDNDLSETEPLEFRTTLNLNVPVTGSLESAGYHQPDKFTRESLQVVYPKALAKPFEKDKASESLVEKVQANPEPPTLHTPAKAHLKKTEEQTRDFLVLLDKKVTLIARVKRRVHLKKFFSTIKLIYSEAVEKEKTEQSHEILKLLSNQYFAYCMETFRETVLQITFLVNSAAANNEEDQGQEEERHSGQPEEAQEFEGTDSQAGSNPECQSPDAMRSERETAEAAANPQQDQNPAELARPEPAEASVDSRENKDLETDINQQSPEKPEPVQQSRLDEFRVRRLLIITKTLLFQKLYILHHEFFAALRAQAEQKKKRTKSFVSRVEQAKKSLDTKHLKYCMHRVFAFAKIRALLGAFTKQCKHEYFGALRQFNHDRSLLACTASEISMVRDESLDISHRKPDSKYHLARYINSHFIQTDPSQGDKARARGRNTNPQNTLEEIRHELSELNSKKLEEISAISRRSDGSRQPEPRPPAKSVSDRDGSAARLFSNDKLKTLTDGWHGSTEPLRLPPTRSKSESFQAANSLSPGDNLIDIQFAPPPPAPGEESVKPKKHDELEPQGGAIMFETFKKGSGTDLDLRRSARFGENSVAEALQWDLAKPPLAAFNQIEEEALNESVRQLEKLSELFKKKTPGQETKKQEHHFFNQNTQAAQSTAARLGAASQLAHIEKNLEQVEQIIRHSEEPHEASEKNEQSFPKEPSDDVAWAKVHFHQGLNFLDKPPAWKQADAHQTVQPKKEPVAKHGPQRDSRSRPVSKERVSETPKHQSAERRAQETSRDAQNPKKPALLGREGKPPLAYSKTQESFRNFFKKLDSDKKDRERGDSASRAPPDNLEVSPLDVTGQDPRPTNEAPLPHSRERTPRGSKSKPQSLTPSNKLKSGKIHAGPVVQSAKELPVRPASGSLADRLERIIHDKQAPQTSKNPIRAELSQQSSIFSPDITGVFRNTVSSEKIRSSHQKKQPMESLADRISSGSNSKKPAIKIRAELAQNRSIRASGSPMKSKSGLGALQKSHPNLPSRPEKPQKLPDKNRLQSGGRKSSKETSRERYLQSAKSVRAASGRSEASKKLDTSNDGFKERYAAVRGELKKSSYIKIADSKRAYQSSK